MLSRHEQQWKIGATLICTTILFLLFWFESFCLGTRNEHETFRVFLGTLLWEVPREELSM